MVRVSFVEVVIYALDLKEGDGHHGWSRDILRIKR